MNRAVGLAALAGLTLGVPAAFASSHREAPAIALDPVADNTDLYAWVTPGTHDKLTVIMAFNPMEEPSGGPNFHGFSKDVLYELHIARGASLADAVTYQFHFSEKAVAGVDPGDLGAPVGGGKEFFIQLTGYAQTYRVLKIEGGITTSIAQGVSVAPPNIGPTTDTVAGGGVPYDDAFAATFIKDMGAEGRVWAGPRDDGFYVDLGGIFDLASLRPKGVAQDGVAGFNCHAIAIEIPTKLLTGTGKSPGEVPGNDTTLGIWSSTSRRKTTILLNNGKSVGMGPWVQVSRLGLPLVNEALIGYQDKDRYNRTTPATDVGNYASYFLSPVMVRDAEAVGIYSALGVDPTPFKADRFDIIDAINLTNIPTPGAHSIPLEATGDVLRVDMAVDSGFPNGRPLIGGAMPHQEQADVTDVLLSLILTKQLSGISDGVDYNDKQFLKTFPYLALPWRGSDQGHGVPTP